MIFVAYFFWLLIFVNTLAAQNRLGSFAGCVTLLLTSLLPLVAIQTLMPAPSRRSWTVLALRPMMHVWIRYRAVGSLWCSLLFQQKIYQNLIIFVTAIFIAQQVISELKGKNVEEVIASGECLYCHNFCFCQILWVFKSSSKLIQEFNNSLPINKKNQGVSRFSFC